MSGELWLFGYKVRNALPIIYRAVYFMLGIIRYYQTEPSSLGTSINNVSKTVSSAGQLTF